MYEKNPEQRTQTGTVTAQLRHSDAPMAMSQDKATVMPQVESAVTRLTSLAHSLEAKVESMAGRLHPVLRSNGPDIGEAKTNRVSSSPLADELYRISDHIEAALTRLAEMEARIEL